MRAKLVCAAAAAVAGLLLVPSVGQAGSQTNPEGTWRSADTSLGAGNLMVIERIGREWSVVAHQAGPMAAPVLTRRTAWVGTVRRLGPSEFELTALQYRMGATGVILAVAVESGKATILDDGTMETALNEAVYSPNRDPSGSAPPNYGCYGTPVARYVRIVMTPPCTR